MKNKEIIQDTKQENKDLSENDILEIKTIDILGFISFLKGKNLLKRPEFYA